MKEAQVTFYVCEKCKERYDTKKEALSCERRPVTQDKGAKVGSVVRILRGDGAGELAKVTEVYVLDKYWGHHVWERYWHTVAVNADIIGGWGSRMLTFDDYELA